MSEPVRYDPNNTNDGKGQIGWRGYFPRTPCTSCGCAFFGWLGDWGLGYACVYCGQKWRLEVAEKRYALWQDAGGEWHCNGMGVIPRESGN